MSHINLPTKKSFGITMNNLNDINERKTGKSRNLPNIKKVQFPHDQMAKTHNDFNAKC